MLPALEAGKARTFTPFRAVQQFLYVVARSAEGRMPINAAMRRISCRNPRHGRKRAAAGDAGREACARQQNHQSVRVAMIGLGGSRVVFGERERRREGKLYFCVSQGSSFCEPVSRRERKQPQFPGRPVVSRDWWLPGLFGLEVLSCSTDDRSYSSPHHTLPSRWSVKNHPRGLVLLTSLSKRPRSGRLASRLRKSSTSSCPGASRQSSTSPR